MPRGGRVYRRINRVPFEFMLGEFRMGVPTLMTGAGLIIATLGLIQLSLVLGIVFAVVGLGILYVFVRIINALDEDGAMSETTVVRTAIRSWINRDNRA